MSRAGDFAIEVDASAFPLVVTTYHRVPTAADFEHLESELVALFRREQRMITVADLEVLEMADATARKRGAEMAERLAGFSARWAICSIVVVRSTLIRGALTAIRWFSKSRVPEHYVASMAEAARVAAEAFEKDGVTLPTATSDRLEAMRSAGAAAE